MSDKPYVNILGFRTPRDDWDRCAPWRKAMLISIAVATWLTIIGMAYGAHVLFDYFTEM